MKSLFRLTEKTDIDPEVMGVGSLIKCPGEKFLIVQDNNSPNIIRLMNMIDYKVSSTHVVVENVNYISENELRQLMSYVCSGAFSDYEFNPKGIK